MSKKTPEELPEEKPPESPPTTNSEPKPEPRPDEYASLKEDAGRVAQRAADALNEAALGRTIVRDTFVTQSRYGVVVTCGADGMNVAKFSGRQTNRKGVENIERFFLGTVCEALTKTAAQKSEAKTKRVVDDFHATMNFADLADKAVAEAQKAGSALQRRIDEEAYEWYPPACMEATTESPVVLATPLDKSFAGDTVDPEHTVPLFGRLFSTIKEVVDRKLGAKLDSIEIGGYHYADCNVLADSYNNKLDSVMPYFGLVIQIKTKDGNQVARMIRGTGGPEVLLANQPGAAVSAEQVAAALAEEAAMLAIDMDRAQGTTILGSECFAVLSAECTGVYVHEAVGHSTESDIICENRRDKSAKLMLKGRIGSQISDNRNFTIVDTGLPDMDLGGGKTFSHGWGTVHFDQKGQPPKEVTLIDKGVQVNVLSSETTINEILAGLPEEVRRGIVAVGLSGSERREKYDNTPLVRMRNTYMKADLKGPKSIEELAAIAPKSKKGVYVRTCEGGWVQPSTGDFMVNAGVSYLIENGQIIWDKPIKGVKISGNLQKFGNQIKRIGGPTTITARFSGYCVSGETLVITGRGPLPISDVTVGDEVLTHRGRHRPVTQVMTRTYEGALHRLYTSLSDLPLRVTPEHPIWTYTRQTGSPTWINAAAIQDSEALLHAYPLPAEPVHVSQGPPPEELVALGRALRAGRPVTYDLVRELGHGQQILLLQGLFGGDFDFRGVSLSYASLLNLRQILLRHGVVATMQEGLLMLDSNALHRLAWVLGKHERHLGSAYPRYGQEADGSRFFILPFTHHDVEAPGVHTVYNLAVAEDNSYVTEAVAVHNCGKDSQWVPVDGVGPAIYVEDVKLSGGGYYMLGFEEVASTYRKQIEERRNKLRSSIYIPELEEWGGISAGEQQELCLVTHAFATLQEEVDLILGKNIHPDFDSTMEDKKNLVS